MTEHTCLQFVPGDQLAAQLGLGAAALRYAQMGYRVLPLNRGSKKPHRMLGWQGGVHHATADPAWISMWWREDPAAGIGIATGQGLLVIDLDVKHGEDGPGEFTRQLAPHLPPAPTVRTPSGGWHLFYRTPQLAVPMRPGLLPGVDFKGDDGYVVAAPSRVVVSAADRPDGTAGGAGDALLPYEWVSGCPCTLPVVPDGMMGWMATAVATGSRTGGDAGDAAPDYEQLRQDGLAPGHRNVDLYRWACSEYRRLGVAGPGTDATVRERAAVILAQTDRRDFGPAEVDRILRSARDFVASREDDDSRQWNSPAGQWLRRQGGES